MVEPKVDLPQDPNQDDMFERAKRYAVDAASDFPVAYDVKTRLPVDSLKGPELAKAILAGTHTVQQGTKVPTIGPNGKPYIVPAENLQDALQHGFTIDDPNNIAARRMADEHPTWTGFVSGIHNASKGMLGIPEAIASGIDPRLDDPVVSAIQARADIQHPNIAIGGRVAGEVATAVGTAGLGDLVGLGRLGLAAEEGITGAKALAAGGEAIIPKALGTGAADLAKAGLPTLADEAAVQGAGLGRRILGSAAKQGIIGAGMEVPRATQQLFNGDPEKAAESIMWGAGLGMLFGAGGQVVETGAWKGLGAAEQFAAARLKQLGAEPGEAISGLAGRAAEKAVHATGTAIGSALGGHGVVGYFASKKMADKAGEMAEAAVEKWLGTEGGQVAQKWLKNLAESPIERGFGEGMAQQGISALAQRMAKVPGVLSSVGTGEIEQHERISNAEAGRIAANAVQLAGNPQGLLEMTGQITSPLNHSPASQAVATALQGKLMNAVNYIADQSPKPPTEMPFTKTNWAPSPLELASMARKLEVVYDPMAVMKRLADGTLTQDHVDALAALYPKTYLDLQKAVMEIGVSPNAPKLTMPQRQKLGLLMGTPMDRLQTPAAVQMLQGNFQPPSPPAASGGGGPAKGAGPRGGPGKPGKVKMTYDRLPKMATNADRIEFGDKEV